MRTILAIDTSSGSTGVALSRGGALLASSLTVKKQRHAESLFKEIDVVFEKAGVAKGDLTGVAVTVGPGSFTGLRVGIATAKGIAFGLSIKMAGVSSLKALSLSGKGFNGIVAPVFDARKGQVYGAGFDGKTGELLIPENAWEPENLAAELLSTKRAVLYLGSGAGAYRETLVTGREGSFYVAPEEKWYVTPGAVALLGEKVFEEGGEISAAHLVPVYHRLSEAEVNKARGALSKGLKI